MIKPLRKSHLRAWIVLAFLIPAGILIAYLAVPGEVLGKLLQEDRTAALPVVISKDEEKRYAVYLRSSADKKNFQLQWISKNALTLPSSLIYQVKNGEKELVGRIGTTGTCYFPLAADTTGIYSFILYDIIHGQTIDTINLKP